MYKFNKILFILIFLEIVGLDFLIALDGEKILKNADGFRGSDSSSVEVIVYLKETKNGKIINKTGYRVWHKGHEKSLAKRIYPKTKNSKYILMVRNNMWHYSSNSFRPLRITPQQKLLGSASNSDIARLGYAYDYNVEEITVDTSNQDYILKLKAKFDYLPYRKIDIRINKKDQKLEKAIYYSITGIPIKTAFFDVYKNFGDNISGPKSMTIQNKMLNKDVKTIIEYKSIKRGDLPNKYFNYNYLKHLE